MHRPPWASFLWAGLFLLTTVLLLLGLVGLYSYQSEAAGVLELAGFLAAFLGTALAFAPPGVQPAAVGAVRIALGGLALLVLAALRGELRSGVGWPPLATTTAAVGIAAYQPFFFAGVARTGVALGTIVAIGSTPVWAGAIGFLFGARNRRSAGESPPPSPSRGAPCSYWTPGAGSASTPRASSSHWRQGPATGPTRRRVSGF